jgi:ATP-binding cassette subfamily C protein CydC
MKVIGRLLRMVAKYWRGVALAVALGWAAVVSWGALMTTSAYLISYAALHPSVAELQVAIVGVRFFGISRGVFRYLERYVSHTVTFKLLAELRVWFYQALEPLAPARLWEYQSGDLLGRIVDDVETLQEFYVRVVAPPVVALLSTGAVLAFYGHWGWDLAVTLLGFQLFTGVMVPLLTRVLGKKPGRVVVETRGQLRAVVGDSLGGMEEITANNRQGMFSEKFQSSSRGLGTEERKMFWIEGLHSGLLALGVNLGMLAVLVLTIPKVVSGQLDGRLLAVLALGALASFEAILPLPVAFQNLERSLQAGRRLFEVVDAVPNVIDGRGKVGLEKNEFGLEIKNLAFAYSQEYEPVLDGIELSMPQGKKVAIVGASGAGKTTLLNLVQRYWEYSEGNILLNGVDIRELDGEDVRRVMAVISQDTFLFNAPIEDNLRLARPNAVAEEIAEAVRRAQISEFLEGLPKGYKTWVGDQGALVSGGERQRIAIARALLKDAPILLLDEPTANLDVFTEQQVINAILDAADEKSVLLVTHRLVGMEAMDEIVVLEGGRIVERGKHKELLEKEGRYARMWGLGRDFIRTQ